MHVHMKTYKLKGSIRIHVEWVVILLNYRFKKSHLATVGIKHTSSKMSCTNMQASTPYSASHASQASYM